MTREAQEQRAARKYLAAFLAREIFKVGDEPGRSVKRIQFRGQGEFDLGGLCEEALVRVLHGALAKYEGNPQ